VATDAQRSHLLSLMRFLLAHEPQVHYAQIRPMRTVTMPEVVMLASLRRGHGITMDCSEAVTCLCKWARLRDPNGRGYNGTGFTGTLLAHLPHYTNPRSARVGALVVFGPSTGHHVCMVMAPGDDPLLWSHGQERGPLRIRLSQERRFQPAGVTFLSIANL
jgi:hypothetical protein